MASVVSAWRGTMARRKRQVKQKPRIEVNAAPPLAHEELADTFDVVGRAKVPQRLRDIELPEPTPYRLSGILRNKVARVASTPLRPMRPGWVSAVVRPKKAPMPPPVRKLMHRGRPVRPGVVFSPDDRRTYSDWRYPWGTVCKVITAVGHGSGVI